MPAKQTSAWHIDITFPDFADGFFPRKLPRWMASNGEKHHYSENIYWLVVSNFFLFFHNLWENPSQLTFIFFRGVGIPPTSIFPVYRCVFPEQKPGFSHAHTGKTHRCDFLGIPGSIWV
jgi:hypothetical protein